MERTIAVALVVYGLALVAALVAGDVWLRREPPVAVPAPAGHPPSVLFNCINLTYDDGFYYFKIAQQVATGAGSTFDGRHPTNGYHPLWLLLLVPIFTLTSSSDTALVAAVLVQGAIWAVTLGLVYRIARLELGRAAAAIGVGLWAAVTFRVALYGLEWSLHALAFLTTVHVWTRWFGGSRDGQDDSPTLMQHGLLGTLVAVTMLARLDNALLAIVLAVAMIWRERHLRPAPAFRHVLVYGLPIVVTGLAYLATNARLFGHIVPVSAATERIWSDSLFAQDPVFRQHGMVWAVTAQILLPLRELDQAFSWTIALGVFAPAVCWLISWSLWLARPQPGDRSLRPWGALVAFSLLQWTLDAALLHGPLNIKPWRYVVQPLLAVMLVGAAIDASRRITRAVPRIAWMQRGLVALLACAIAGYTFWSIDRWHALIHAPQARDPLLDMTEWSRANLPADAVIGAWNAGMLGYLSGRQVVNLDGVVNSWDYYDSERLDLCRYWTRNGITHIVDVFDDREALSVVPTRPAYAGCVDRLEPVWSNHHYAAPWRAAAYRLRAP